MGKESRYPSDVPVDNLFKPFLGEKKMENEIEVISTSESTKQQVEIVDFNIPFWSIVGFLLKLTFAAIPAAIIIASIVWAVMLLLMIMGAAISR